MKFIIYKQTFVYEIQIHYYFDSFDSVKCAILKSHYQKTVD